MQGPARVLRVMLVKLVQGAVGRSVSARNIILFGGRFWLFESNVVILLNSDDIHILS